MFVLSMKGSNLKLVGVFLLSAVIIALFVAFMPSVPSGDAQSVPSVRQYDESDFENITTSEDRVAFLKRYGWEVELEASEVSDVTIPAEFDNVYRQYNELQKGEGLDLEDYKNKTVTRYTYVVTNYDYDGTVYANLLVYKDRVIGGDICSADINGFLHGFTKGNDFVK